MELHPELSVLLAIATGTFLKLVYLLKSYAYRKRPVNAKQVGNVASINFYPVKSCSVVSLQEAKCTFEGLQHLTWFDRHFMICKDDGKFLNIKQESKLVLIKPTFNRDDLHLDAPNMETLVISEPSSMNEKENIMMCSLYGESIEGINCGEQASDWLRRFFGKPYHLVYSSATLQKRQLSTSGSSKWHELTRPQDKAAFQDFSSYMLATEESLNDLASRVELPVDMRCFRPNIVVSGCSKAFEEDAWNEIFIGDAKFTNIKPCDRCVITTVDPDTGIKNPNVEPLKTLRSYRLKAETGQSPCFGVNIFTDWEGTIRVGDAVYAVFA